MFKRIVVAQAMALALVVPGTAAADIWVNGSVKNETAVFTKGGQVTGQAKSTLDNASDYAGGSLMKFENSARFFLNGDLGENALWHGELNFIYDAEGVNDRYRGYRQYSTHDWFREFYVDYYADDWEFRIGKQQVVWGTADGIKLLDIINPSDFREFNQNTFEDFRIPVFMLKAERLIGNRGNLQIIISEQEENKIAGLNKDGDAGHPFIFKGVDTITGQVNGFLNIAPGLGNVARTFDTFATDAVSPNGLTNVAPVGVSVQNFVSQTPGAGASFGLVGCTLANGLALPGGPNPGAACLNTIAQTSSFAQGGFPNAGALPQGSNNNQVNLIDGGAPIRNAAIATSDNSFWNPANPNSPFEYFPDTSFGTFDNFVNLNTVYRRDYPDDLDLNYGVRFKSTTDGGTNWSVNYFYAYDPNPSVSIHWEAPNGDRVFPIVDTNNNNWIQLHNGPNASPDAPDAAASGTRRCSAGTGAGAGGTPDIQPNTVNGSGCALVFEETVHRIHNVGASFDTSIDRFSFPVIVRGEFLYQPDVRVPIIDRGELAIGNLTKALTVGKADFVKYVIGIDVTVLTNLFVSTQFIQFVNTDHVDDPSPRNRDITNARAANGLAPILGSTANYRRYTGDLPTLHLDNDLNAADKYENFVSLFFSKPFGPSQEHRWNNITIYEEEGGWWNRFDVEYSFSDTLIGTMEWNHYWGNENTLFGQFNNSSSFQVGVKYLIE